MISLDKGTSKTKSLTKQAIGVPISTIDVVANFKRLLIKIIETD